MNAEIFLNVSANIAMALLGLGVVLTLVRLVRGPTLPDRVLALDLLTLIAAGLAGLFSTRSGTTAELDIALALCLVGFVSTAAFAHYISARQPHESTTKGKATDP